MAALEHDTNGPANREQNIHMNIVQILGDRTIFIN